ncbi:MAG: hypothetical protein WKF96_19620 [Solirubrobacteraceae bacterium]
MCARAIRRIVLTTLALTAIAFTGGVGAAQAAPTVGFASTPGFGYWVANSDGGVFSFGDARFHGSLGGVPLSSPIVGIAATPDGGGYWLVGGDGGVLAFGNATFRGSLSGVPLNSPIVGMARTPDGGGYWLAGADGGVFSFGNAPFYGSLSGQRLNAPAVAIGPTPDGKGYWLAAQDGGVFAYGTAPFQGTPSAPLPPGPPPFVPPRALPPATAPVAGRLITVARVVGRVTVTLPGSQRAQVLTNRSTIPNNSEVDATRGRVQLTQAIRNRSVQQTEARFGRFVVKLTKARGTTMRLSAPLISCARGARSRAAREQPTNTHAARRRRRRSRRLWVKDRGGSWTTYGQHAAATAEGTRWTMLDTCSSTTVTVLEGTVEVRPRDGRPSFDVRAPRRVVVHAR